ncbi:serine/threonine-protein kinase [Candidatus Margulisiibacteriota bacterium]
MKGLHKKKHAQSFNIPNFNCKKTQNKLDLITCNNNKYKIRDPIGAGAFGTVYLAEDQKTNKKIAIKVQSSSLLEDFVREIQMMQILNKNGVSGIGKMLFFAKSKEKYLLAMEYIEGKNLGSAFSKNNLNLINKIELLIDIAKNLEEIHKSGITHNDLKPDNIMVNKNRQLSKICDFGTSKDNKLYPDKITRGTPIYESPESKRFEIMNNFIDEQKKDVYSLAVIFYELIYKPNVGNFSVIFGDKKFFQKTVTKKQINKGRLDDFISNTLKSKPNPPHKIHTSKKKKKLITHIFKKKKPIYKKMFENLLYHMSHSNVKKRHTMSQVVQDLEDIKKLIPKKRSD